jgi:hypothetical protein
MGLSPARINALVKEKLAEAQFPAGSYAEDDYNVPIPHPMREDRRVPTDRITSRLELTQYDTSLSYKKVEDVLPFIRSVEIPLKQHTGAPAVSVVELGQSVTTGDLIGEMPEGSIGARVHASISGVVSFTDEERIILTKTDAG